MKIRISKLSALLLAPVLSGALLVLAFPTHDLWLLAWVGLVPLLVAISSVRPKYAFILSYICGIIFFAGNFLWLFEVPKYKFLHHCLIVSYWGIFIGFFGWAFSVIARSLGAKYAFLGAPFIWVCFEYIKSNFGFLALPWPWLAHSQFQVLSVIQISSVAGAYGVSFLIVMFNSALAALVLYLVNKSSKKEPIFCEPISERGVIGVVCVAALLIGFTLLYGRMALSRSIAGNEIKVSVVQGDIEQAKKWDPRYSKVIMKTYADLTRAASRSQPRLIVWPEAATPGYLLNNSILLRQMTSLVQQTNAHFLVGSSEHAKFSPDPKLRFRIGNTALLFSPEGRIVGQYLKIHLLPFGEYLPMEEIIPWSWIRVPKLASQISGKEYTVFECDGLRFGVNICWEVGFPDLVRQFVLRGAECMLNLTNMAWFGKSAAPYQMLSVSVFRAVENRIFIVRCANTGISCFIDPCGRIVNRVKDGSGQDIFVRGILTESVIPMDSRTVYTGYGDWLVWVSMFFSLTFLLMAFLRRRPRV